MYAQWGKRAFDITCGLIGAILLIPLMLLCAVAIALTMGTPVLFRQERAGLHGRAFIMTKFRTMHDYRDEAGHLLSDAERVSRLGTFLRRARFDELPEFLQILTGKLSMVGPRPLPSHLLEAHGVLEQRGRVRPGMTGLAQISGNTLLTTEEKLAIDLLYTRDHTFGSDICILWHTFVTVVRGERRDERVIRKAVSRA